uniref:Protein odr-4 homolog n=1 Tax=Gouania willdenowi TaxID=441366 RepID=A0A8C5DIQ0_GOUWI
MGRGYIVEEAVEGYLSKLCEQQAGPITGLLIGQSSALRDFVVMATRTPLREDDATTLARNPVDKLWVTEHARQVSRMLPGGLSVLGVFLISDTDSKETLTTLRQLVFGVENLISSDCLWTPADDDITDHVTLQVNPKTRKTVCRTFDVKDPKSSAKPADWKYQSGVCASWPSVSCCLNVDLLVQLPENRTSAEDLDQCLKEGLKTWTHQINNGVCLIDGKKLTEEHELTAGQQEQSPVDLVRPSGGRVSISGAIHSRAFLYSNKPKAKLAEKRDVVSTVTTRVQMVLEELLTSGQDNRHTEHLCLPRRVFCPVNGPVSVCDYQFSDEGLCEVSERLKEMLDISTTDEDLDVRQETAAELIQDDVTAGLCFYRNILNVDLNNFEHYALWVVTAAAVVLLSAAASMLYLSDV